MVARLYIARAMARQWSCGSCQVVFVLGARWGVIDGLLVGVTEWEVGEPHESSERFIHSLRDAVVSYCIGIVVMGRAGPARRRLLGI